jgi:type-F conjugative transfer system secretin TraK
MRQGFLFSLVAMIVMLSNIIVQAAQELTVKDQDKIEVILSENDVNRIALVNDRIKAIYGSQDKVHIVTDEENGQVFITPKVKNGLKFSMSLVTESNATIDLKVTPVKTSSETLLLKLDKRTEEERGKEARLKEKSIKELIKSAFSGRSIKGYRTLEIKDKSPDKNNKSLIQQREYLGSKFKAALFEYKNLKQSKEVLSEQMFKITARSIAVAIAKKTLKPGEKTKIVVIENVEK